MVNRRGDKAETDAATSPVKASIQEKIAAYAMLDAMGDVSLAQKAVRLSNIGFSGAEIASMLQTTPATVYQYVYQAKRGDRRPRAKTTATE